MYANIHVKKFISKLQICVQGLIEEKRQQFMNRVQVDLKRSPIANIEHTTLLAWFRCVECFLRKGHHISSET